MTQKKKGRKPRSPFKKQTYKLLSPLVAEINQTAINAGISFSAVIERALNSFMDQEVIIKKQPRKIITTNQAVETVAFVDELARDMKTPKTQVVEHLMNEFFSKPEAQRMEILKNGK